MFAVIKTGGKQYKVAADDVIKIEKLEGEVGDIVTFDSVLMLGSGADVTVGEPLVEGALVAAELVDTKKQKTVIIFKKNRRHNYRRRNGHRQWLTTVRITEILTGGKKPSAAKKAAPAKAAADTKAEAPAKKAPAAKKAAAPKAAAKAAAKPAAEKKPAAKTAAKAPAKAKAAAKADKE